MFARQTNKLNTVPSNYLNQLKKLADKSRCYQSIAIPPGPLHVCTILKKDPKLATKRTPSDFKKLCYSNFQQNNNRPTAKIIDC
jgi:hypothetical protein